MLVSDPAGEWSTQNVLAFTDNNGDVGGPQPMVADANFDGDGYDTPIDFTGEKVAYARIDPEDEFAVQFAISAAMLEHPTEFLWGARADNGLKDITGLDYNDTMGPSAAGSPMLDEDYPVQDLFNLDSTCRLPYGLTQSESIPGMCLIGRVPAAKPAKDKPETPPEKPPVIPPPN